MSLWAATYATRSRRMARRSIVRECFSMIAIVPKITVYIQDAYTRTRQDKREEKKKESHSWKWSSTRTWRCSFLLLFRAINRFCVARVIRRPDIALLIFLKVLPLPDCVLGAMRLIFLACVYPLRSAASFHRWERCKIPQNTAVPCPIETGWRSQNCTCVAFEINGSRLFVPESCVSSQGASCVKRACGLTHHVGKGRCIHLNSRPVPRERL